LHHQPFTRTVLPKGKNQGQSELQAQLASEDRTRRVGRDGGGPSTEIVIEDLFELMYEPS